MWKKAELVWPVGLGGPAAHPLMPAKVLEVYEEARSIARQSPRSSAALLRVALERLVADLTNGKKLNEGIGQLVDEGLPTSIQRAMDVLRVWGNNALHPGEIDVSDNPQTVEALFKLLNIIVEERIARPAEIDSLFSALPTGALEAIERRDGAR